MTCEVTLSWSDVLAAEPGDEWIVFLAPTANVVAYSDSGPVEYGLVDCGEFFSEDLTFTVPNFDVDITPEVLVNVLIRRNGCVVAETRNLYINPDNVTCGGTVAIDGQQTEPILLGGCIEGLEVSQ